MRRRARRSRGGEWSKAPVDGARLVRRHCGSGVVYRASRLRLRLRMQVQVQVQVQVQTVDRGPWTVEQPAQVTACGQAALKGAACGISEPGGRRRKQPSAGVPRACAFQRLAAFTVPARSAHAQRARRHHCLARDTNDWRRSAHSSYNCRFMSTGSAGCARADSAPHRSTRVRSSPLVARLASCGSKRMRAMRRARARIRERAAACAAIGEGRPGGGRRDTKTNRRAASFLAAEG